MALVNKNAAILVKDIIAKEKLGEAVLSLLIDTNKQIELSNNIKTLAKSNAANDIVKEIIQNISYPNANE
jgi:UDP-N-acetylglucosamine--N-acetylmuramyl-(pentapeptide) pyrophosphoryl-undecaprenol N-acetylglucosamine transferase